MTAVRWVGGRAGGLPWEALLLQRQGPRSGWGPEPPRAGGLGGGGVVVLGCG